jgi:serum/glucocorticoid-regulated kinase 2
MYRKILQEPLRFPDEVSSEARSLLVGLLNRDPAHRLGNRGAEEIRSHPFFSRHIDWKKLVAKKIQPPFKPAVVSLLSLPVILLLFSVMCRSDWMLTNTIPLFF